MPTPRIRVGLDTSTAKKDLEQLKAELKAISDSAQRIKVAFDVSSASGVKRMNEEIKRTTTTTKEAALSQEAFNRATAALGDVTAKAAKDLNLDIGVLTKTSEAFRRLALAADGATKVELEFAKAKSIVYKEVAAGNISMEQAAAVLRQYKTELIRNATAQNAFIGGLMKIRSELSSLRKVAFTLNSVVAATFFVAQGLKFTAGAAAEFQNAQAKMIGLTNNSREAIERMSPALKTLAVTYGQSLTDVEQAAFLATSVLPAAQSLKVLDAAAKASVAGLGKMGPVVQLITEALLKYKDAGYSAAQVTGILIQSVRSGQIDPATFAQSFGRVITVAHALGISLNDAASAMAVLTRTMPSARRAATYVIAAMRGLLKPSKGSSQAMEEMGMALGRVGVNFQHFRQIARTQGFAVALQEMVNTVHKFIEENKKAGQSTKDFASELAKEFPNIRTYIGVLALAGANQQEIANIFSLGAKAGAQTLQGAFTAHLKDTLLQWHKFMAALQVSMENLGEVINSVVTPVLEVLTKHSQAFMTTMENLGVFIITFVVGKALTAMVLALKNTTIGLVATVQKLFMVSPAATAAAEAETRLVTAATDVTAAQSAAGEAIATTASEAEAAAGSMAALAGEEAAAGAALSVSTLVGGLTAIVGLVALWAMHQNDVNAAMEKSHERTTELLNLAKEQVATSEGGPGAGLSQDITNQISDLQKQAQNLNKKMVEAVKPLGITDIFKPKNILEALATGGNLTNIAFTEQAAKVRSLGQAYQNTQKQMFALIEAKIQLDAAMAKNPGVGTAGTPGHEFSPNFLKFIRTLESVPVKTKNLTELQRQAQLINEAVTKWESKLKPGQHATAYEFRAIENAVINTFGKQNAQNVKDFIKQLDNLAIKSNEVTAAEAKQEFIQEELNKARAKYKYSFSGVDKSAVEAAASAHWQKQEAATMDQVAAKLDRQVQAYSTLNGAEQENVFITKELQKAQNAVHHKLTAPEVEKITQIAEHLYQLRALSKFVFGTIQQFATQAARNMQNAMANFFINPFKNGLRGLVNSFAVAIQKMIAQLLALMVWKQLLQAIGFGGFASAATSAGGVSGAWQDVGGAMGGGSRQGNAFNNGARIAYALGGVVGDATTFPMSNGKTGLMGEAGPEAIMPLARGADGTLGVRVTNWGQSKSKGISGSVRIENNFDARGAGPDETAKVLGLAVHLRQQLHRDFEYYDQYGEWPNG